MKHIVKHARQQQRSKKTLDENARIVKWMQEHPPMSQRDAAARMTEEFGTTVSQAKVCRALKGEPDP